MASFNFKQSLNTVVNTKCRIALTRLTVSSHRLEIEMGRWHKPNKSIRSERKCQHCNVLENEFHFILECPVYHEIRSQQVNVTGKDQNAYIYRIIHVRKQENCQ